MARVARRRRDGVLGTSLREAFGDLGIDYRAAIASSTPGRLREQYRFARNTGELVERKSTSYSEIPVIRGGACESTSPPAVRTSRGSSFGHVGRHFHLQSST
jgi:hypothetical protein